MNVYIFILLILFIYMTFWYFLALLKKRTDVVDISWGLGFPLVAWITFFIYPYSFISLIVNILITIWGVRLARHIYKRFISRPEDPRYAAFRNNWKFFNVRSYFQIFLLQGILLFFIALPAIFTNVKYPTGFSWFIPAGILVWIIGFYFESTGDKQLATFLKNPENKGKIMQDGLWKYTRHPNYFGEVTMWWGIFIISLVNPGASLTIISPIIITYLLLFVSGIPMTEKGYLGNSEFEEYKKRTSAFFPFPPKKKIENKEIEENLSETFHI